MNVKATTGMFIIGLVVIVAAYDFWAYYQAGTEGTLSYTLQDWAYRFPAVTFLVGFTCGHLYWPMQKSPKNEN